MSMESKAKFFFSVAHLEHPIPKYTMYGIVLPTWMVHFYGKHVGKYM